MIFLLKWWREIGIAVLVLAVVAACHARDTALQERGRALEKVRVADSTLKVLRPALARTDTLLQTRVRTVTQTIARLDTIRDSVFTRIHDSVYVTQYILRTDTALANCLTLAVTCRAYRDTATAVIAALESKVKAIPLAVPRSCVSTGVVSLASGLLGGFALFRLAR